jgi:hypothetical protein
LIASPSCERPEKEQKAKLSEASGTRIFRKWGKANLQILRSGMALLAIFLFILTFYAGLNKILKEVG